MNNENKFFLDDAEIDDIIKISEIVIDELHTNGIDLDDKNIYDVAEISLDLYNSIYKSSADNSMETVKATINNVFQYSFSVVDELVAKVDKFKKDSNYSLKDLIGDDISVFEKLITLIDKKDKSPDDIKKILEFAAKYKLAFPDSVSYNTQGSSEQEAFKKVLESSSNSYLAAEDFKKDYMDRAVKNLADSINDKAGSTGFNAGQIQGILADLGLPKNKHLSEIIDLTSRHYNQYLDSVKKKQTGIQGLGEDEFEIVQVENDPKLESAMRGEDFEGGASSGASKGKESSAVALEKNAKCLDLINKHLDLKVKRSRTFEGYISSKFAADDVPEKVITKIKGDGDTKPESSKTVKDPSELKIPTPTKLKEVSASLQKSLESIKTYISKQKDAKIPVSDTTIQNLNTLMVLDELVSTYSSTMKSFAGGYAAKLAKVKNNPRELEALIYEKNTFIKSYKNIINLARIFPSNVANFTNRVSDVMKFNTLLNRYSRLKNKNVEESLDEAQQVSKNVAKGKEDTLGAKDSLLEYYSNFEANPKLGKGRLSNLHSFLVNSFGENSKLLNDKKINTEIFSKKDITTSIPEFIEKYVSVNELENAKTNLKSLNKDTLKELALNIGISKSNISNIIYHKKTDTAKDKGQDYNEKIATFFNEKLKEYYELKLLATNDTQIPDLDTKRKKVLNSLSTTYKDNVDKEKVVKKTTTPSLPKKNIEDPAEYKAKYIIDFRKDLADLMFGRGFEGEDPIKKEKIDPTKSEESTMTPYISEKGGSYSVSDMGQLKKIIDELKPLLEGAVATYTQQLAVNEDKAAFFEKIEAKLTELGNMFSKETPSEYANLIDEMMNLKAQDLASAKESMRNMNSFSARLAAEEAEKGARDYLKLYTKVKEFFTRALNAMDVIRNVTMEMARRGPDEQKYAAFTTKTDAYYVLESLSDGSFKPNDYVYFDMDASALTTQMTFNAKSKTDDEAIKTDPMFRAKTDKRSNTILSDVQELYSQLKNAMAILENNAGDLADKPKNSDIFNEEAAAAGKKKREEDALSNKDKEKMELDPSKAKSNYETYIDTKEKYDKAKNKKPEKTIDTEIASIQAYIDRKNQAITNINKKINILNTLQEEAAAGKDLSQLPENLKVLLHDAGGVKGIPQAIKLVVSERDTLTNNLNRDLPGLEQKLEFLKQQKETGAAKVSE